MRQVAAWAMISSLALAAHAAPASLPDDIKAKVEARARQVKAWGTDPKIVAAVKAYNAAPPAQARGMTNEKWKTLTVLDPFVRSLIKSDLGEYLKAKRDDTISEAFISGANGTKVAFLAKTTSWTHGDKDKHKIPMTGKIWFGLVEVDESSGLQQVQVGLPVLDGRKPIGSIVVGLAIARLR